MALVIKKPPPKLEVDTQEDGVVALQKNHGIPDEVFSIGILSHEYHERLIADLDRVAEVAGIPKQFVWSKVSEYCTEPEVAWIKRMRKGQDHGLAYIGKKSKPISDKMMAIVGACLRNYIDARLMTVQEVLLRLKNDTMPQPTVLLIPNFSLEKKDGGDIPQWQVSSLLGLLYTRLARGLKTVVFISDMNSLSMFYGESFKKHIDSHYTKV